jgi:copper resistance protein B
MSRAFFAVPLLLAASGALAQQDPFPLPPRDWPRPVKDTERFTFLLLDRLEYRAKSGKDAWGWDAQGWWGGDYNKLWFKSEGEGEWRGAAESADVQALYARRISPYFHLQAGVRQEARPAPSRNQGVVAVQGLAPYWFNVEGSLFFGNGVSGRFEAEYDQLFTQRLILQPRIETNFSGSADRERGVGSGVNDIELGLRLRYEIRREIAPYIGIEWTRKLGATADLTRDAGHDVSETALVLGVRIWY